MSEIMDYRMQQHHFAQEVLYRQRMAQRLPDPWSMGHIPSAYKLKDVDAKLQNGDLWRSFSKHGTEMIITKSGRRMFPSVRVNLFGLEDDASYCLMLEMVPIGDCRFKFSGSQWVPAGGAEPQSPQRMYLHPDSPALGSHWKSQSISFSKTKLTNNTFDSNGHIVLTSMHKYRPRLHIIRTSDPNQIPWAPSQSFFFSETDFVAVTAYQNDQITKLKIDNNPFAKGFRETGQSRCKRKQIGQPSPTSSPEPPTSPESNYSSAKSIKRMRSQSISSEGSERYSSEYTSRTMSPQNEEECRLEEVPYVAENISYSFLHQQFMESIANYQKIRQQLYSNSHSDHLTGLIRPGWMEFALNFSRIGLSMSEQKTSMTHGLDSQQQQLLYA